MHERMLFESDVWHTHSDHPLALLTVAKRYQLDYLEYRVKIGWFLIGVTYLVVLLTILLGCQPFPKNWQIYPDPGSTSVHIPASSSSN